MVPLIGREYSSFGFTRTAKQEASPRERTMKKDFIKWYAIRLLVASFAIGFLSTATEALVLYVGGTAVFDQTGAVAAFSVLHLLVGTVMSAFVHYFILAVASVFIIGGVAVTMALRSSGTVGNPTPTADGDAALKAFAKKFATVVLIVAAISAGYNSLGLYVLMSAVSDAAGLVVLATVMTFVLSLTYATFVYGFIAAVGTAMFAFIVSFIRGRKNSNTGE